MKKFLSILITLSMMFSVLPSFQMEVHAASIKYRQTSKANVPLRNAVGENETKVDYITSKGTAFKIIQTHQNWINAVWYTTWYKVEVLQGTTKNGKSGEFWIYSENTTKHDKHSYKDGRCTTKGCSATQGITSEESYSISLESKYDNVPLKVTPFNEGEIIQKVSKGRVLTPIAEIKNNRGSTWYRLVDGSYVWSGNVEAMVCRDKEDLAKKEIIAINDYYNTPVDKRPSYFKPSIPVAKPACFGTAHVYSAGKCVYCNVAYPIKEELVTGKTYKAKKGTVARENPWEQSRQTHEYDEGAIVTVTHKTTYKEQTWYKTNYGWVYGLEDVSLKEIMIDIGTNYTFYTLGTVTPRVITKPSNAVISNWNWHSEDPDYVDVDKKTGVITAKKATPEGKCAKIEYTCTSKEGTSKTITINVKVDEIAVLDSWNYNNQTYNSELALQCAEYSALAYLDIGYSLACDRENNEVLSLYKTSKTKIPSRLTDLLKHRRFTYSIDESYLNLTNTNCPFVIASKKVKHNGDKKDLVYVIIQGSATQEAWQGNMQITGSTYKNVADGYHYTFKEAANDIKNQLNSYISLNGIKKPLVVITGHSRGAAAGNILAAELTENTTSYEKIYAYLFATPNVKTGSVKKLSNIYNICNELDFVTYMPFTDKWGYRRHGIDKYFNSKYWILNNTEFKQNVSKYEVNDYSWQVMTPQKISRYIEGVWKDVSKYYSPTLSICATTPYDYFYGGLACAASNAGGKSDILVHALPACPFFPLTQFFLGNAFPGAELLDAFGDCHSIFTYYSAIASGIQPQTQSNVSLQSIELFSENTTELNQDERDALYSFFTHDENKLMLETNGWDINDTSTWVGIEWNENGNVTKIDLSYLNLSGWFFAYEFPELQELNLDGNNISLLDVSSSENLVDLSCMSNNLSSLIVNDCANLQNLDCSFNQIGSLNLSNRSQLVELNCYGNSIKKLNLNGATALQTVRCGNNELTTVDISTNTSLNTFYCGDNRIVESQNSDLVESINAINLNGGSAIIGTQKYNDSFEFNEDELASLTQFANMSLNLEKLGWDLENPYTWQGVEWQIKATEEVLDDGTKEVREEYHITSLDFDGLDLEGDLCMPETEFVESVSCADSSLTTLNLSGCSSLSSVNCNNAGISELTIDGCSSLQSINCNDNYLEVEIVESSLNQMGLNTGIATYENQNIDAIDECFNETERMVLIDLLLLRDNTEKLDWDLDWPGTWDGIVWTNVDGEYRVNKIDLAETEVYGILDLTAFEYLEDFNFSGTQIESVTLPECITQIPDAAFYNSGIETVYMKDGITNIGKSAFAYCENLNSVVLPKTIAKVFDNAFMGSKNLKYVVFTGDEPLLTGTDIFYDVSPEFNLVYFASTTWNEDAEILSNCNNIVSKDDYIILLDKPIELKPDDYYHETNTYAGDEITFTVATKTPGITTTPMLTVSNENGKLDSFNSCEAKLDSYHNIVTFEDVNVQYVGEEYCKIKAFLWSDVKSISPIANSVEKILVKPIYN